MSSCTNTFRNLLPLWTSNVWPTNSGVIVHARAHVRIGCLARRSFSVVTLRNSFSSTYGPFFALLLIAFSAISHCGFRIADCGLKANPQSEIRNPKSHIHRLRPLLELAELATAEDKAFAVLARAAGDAALGGDAGLADRVPAAVGAAF